MDLAFDPWSLGFRPYTPAVSPSFRFHLTAATVAILALAGLAGTLILLPDLRPAEPSAADLLPAEATVVYAELGDGALLPAAQAFLPALRIVPSAADAVALAVVRRNGITDWLLFRRAPEGSTDPFVVTASRTDALNLLRSGTPLSADRAFYPLLPRDGAIRIVARTGELPQADATLAHWFSLPGPIGLSLDTDRARLSLPPAQASGTSPVLSPIPGVSLGIAGADLRALLSSAAVSGRAPLPLLARALASGQALDAFGPEVGIDADLSPLAAGPAALYVASGSGRVSMAFDGEAPTRAMADALALRLETSLTSASPAIRREARAFENDFRLDALRGGSGSVAASEEPLGDWTLRTLTRQSDGRAVAIARNGRRLLVADDPSLARRVLAAQSLAAAPPAMSRVLGSGWVDRAALERTIRAAFPSFDRSGALPLHDLPWQGPLAWIAALEGGRTMLTIGPSSPPALTTASEEPAARPVDIR